jgi:hypothetical protein
VPTPGKLLFAGFEIEVDNGGESNENVRKALLDGTIEELYCKHDGSLTRGFEVVSHPGTWQYWKEFDFHTWSTALKKLNYRSYNTSTCGMHVHISRASLTTLDIYKLLRFLRDNSDLVQYVSRRQAGKLEQWARIDKDSVEHLALKVKQSPEHRPSSRYMALNLENARTVEFRIFRGTLDVAAIKRNLALCFALVHFVKWAGFRQLTKAHFRVWLKVEGRYIIGEPEGKALLSWITGTGESPDIEM